MAAVHDDVYSIPDSTASFQPDKITEQMQKAEIFLQKAKGLFSKPGVAGDFSRLSEFIFWLIRNNKVHGNSSIGALVGGILHRLWTGARPSLTDVAESLNAAVSTVQKAGTKYVYLYVPFKRSFVRLFPGSTHNKHLSNTH